MEKNTPCETHSGFLWGGGGSQYCSTSGGKGGLQSGGAVGHMKGEGKVTEGTVDKPQALSKWSMLAFG